MVKRGIPEHSMGILIHKLENIRASIGAKKILKDKLEEYTEKIAERAVIYMNHAGRKTLMASDIKLAILDLKS